MPFQKTKLTLVNFFVLSFLALALIFLASMAELLLSFGRVTEKISSDELQGYYQLTSSVIEKTIEQYVLVASQMATDPAVVEAINDPAVRSEKAVYAITKGKINFGFEESYLLYQNGRVLFRNANEAGLMTSASFSDQMRMAMNSKSAKVFIDNSIAYNAPILYVVHPVAAKTGNGVLVVGKILDQPTLRRLEPDQSKAVLFFSSDGKVISSNLDVSAFNRHLDPGSMVDFLRKASRSIATHVDLQEDALYGNFLIAPLYYKSDIIGPVGFFVDTSGFRNIEKRFFVAILMVSSAVVLFLFFVLFMISRKITRPIISLKRGFAAVSNGDFGVRLESDGLREFAEIADGFNYSAESIARKTNELVVERDRFEVIVSSMADGLIVVNRDCKIELANRSAESMLGVPVKKMIGKNVYKILDVLKEGKPLLAEDRPIALALKAKSFRSGIENDLAYRTVDGRIVPVSISAAPLKDGTGIIGAVSIFHNNTDDVELDKMKSEFISLASHQLRTPLSAIRWFAEMLSNGDAGPVTEQQKDFLDSLTTAALRMNDLVNGLLNISRLESGRLAIDAQPIDIPKLCQEVGGTIAPLIAKKGHTFEFRVPDNLPAIVSDPKLVEEVVTNLLSNAIKYTPDKGKIALTVELKKTEMVFQISDNGLGIPKNDQAKIFQKFFRAGNVVVAETEGTGLGLYIVKKIVDSLNGKIWFKSNVGTTFYFSLPLAGIKGKKGEKRLSLKQ